MARKRICVGEWVKVKVESRSPVYSKGRIIRIMRKKAIVLFGKQQREVSLSAVVPWNSRIKNDKSQS